MKKRILAGMTILLTALFTSGLLSAADQSATCPTIKKPASVIATLLPPELKRTLNLIPNDAIAAGFVNAEAIINGKIFAEVLKSSGMDLETLLATGGKKKEDMEGCAVFFVKLKPQTAEAAASPIPALEIGGAVVYKRGTVVSELFAKSAEDIQKEIAELDQDAAASIKVEKIQISGKNAFVLSAPELNATFVAVAAAKNIIQFRLFFNTDPVKELIPSRGTVTSAASSLDLNSAFSASLDAMQARSLASEIQDDAVLQTVQLASCSITEKDNGLVLIFRVAANSADSVQLIKGQIDAALAGLKDDPSFGSIAGKTTVTVEKGTDVVVRSFIPSEFILQNLQGLGAAQEEDFEESSEE